MAVDRPITGRRVRSTVTPEPLGNTLTPVGAVRVLTLVGFTLARPAVHVRPPPPGPWPVVLAPPLAVPSHITAYT